MRMTLLRPLLALIALFLATFGGAVGVLTVTSPTSGDYLGRTNTITFNVTGASVQVRVKAVATGPDGTTIPTQTVNLTPSTDGTASGSISLNFSQGTKEGAYSIVVSATEGGVALTPTTIPVVVDVVAPKFTELSPVTGGYARSVIKIRAAVEEANVDSWRVQVNGEDIPNGTGEGNTIAVDYDPSGLTSDGVQSILITVTDKAKNSSSKTISITLDRVKPTVSIVYPTSGTRVTKGQDLTVIVDVTDASSSSVARTGVDVILKKTDGSFIGRVTLVSFRSTSDTTQRWTGRVRYRRNLFPTMFLVTATVVDRAGNAAALQQVTAHYGK